MFSISWKDGRAGESAQTIRQHNTETKLKNVRTIRRALDRDATRLRATSCFPYPASSVFSFRIRILFASLHSCLFDVVALTPAANCLAVGMGATAGQPCMSPKAHRGFKICPKAINQHGAITANPQNLNICEKSVLKTPLAPNP